MNPLRVQAPIYAQGSAAIGTMVKPFGGNEIDVDHICPAAATVHGSNLTGRKPWSEIALRNIDITGPSWKNAPLVAALRCFCD